MDEVIAKNALIAFGAMFAAIVTGFFAFVSLINSKEQKVSEFRQQWIDSLRNSISSYISSLSYLSLLFKYHNESADDEKRTKFEMAKEIEKTYIEVNESYNNILFRINKTEKRAEQNRLNSDFLSSLEKTRGHYLVSKYSEAVRGCDELREKTKPLLKYEWERVKKGEPAYIVSKWLSVAVLAVGVGLAGFSAFFIYSYSNQRSLNETTENHNNLAKPQPHQALSDSTGSNGAEPAVGH